MRRASARRAPRTTPPRFANPIPHHARSGENIAAPAGCSARRAASTGRVPKDRSGWDRAVSEPQSARRGPRISALHKIAGAVRAIVGWNDRSRRAVEGHRDDTRRSSRTTVRQTRTASRHVSSSGRSRHCWHRAVRTDPIGGADDAAHGLTTDAAGDRSRRGAPFAAAPRTEPPKRRGVAASRPRSRSAAECPSA
jgi:hypothetical protein